jgi:hypothetical protein
VAWTLRERGTEIVLCDKIDLRATDIYTACSFRDITGQRTEKVVKALRFIEQRINAMIEIWGVDDIAFKVDNIASRIKEFAQTVREEDRFLHGPRARDEGLKQEDVDQMLRDARGQTTGSASLHAGAVQEPPSAETVGAAFEPPEPLTLQELDPVKRASLFG